MPNDSGSNDGSPSNGDKSPIRSRSDPGEPGSFRAVPPSDPGEPGSFQPIGAQSDPGEPGSFLVSGTVVAFGIGALLGAAAGLLWCKCCKRGKSDR